MMQSRCRRQRSERQVALLGGPNWRVMAINRRLSSRVIGWVWRYALNTLDVAQPVSVSSVKRSASYPREPLVRLWRRRWLRHCRQKSSKPPAQTANTEGWNISIEATHGNVTRRIFAKEIYNMPADFCLSSNYEEVAEYLSSLRPILDSEIKKKKQHHEWTRFNRRRRVSDPRIESYTAFETIERITPAAALVIAAEYDRVQTSLKTPMHAINLRRWDPQVRSTLRRLGFLKLFDIETHAKDKNSQVEILEFVKGTRIEEEAVSFILDALINMAFGQDLTREEFDRKDELVGKAYRGMIEAVENVRQHAYPDEAGDTAEGWAAAQWWMTGAFDRVHQSLTIVLYDVGVSIPVSLPTWPGWGVIRPILERALRADMQTVDSGFDHAAVYAAMRMGRSSTGMRHRGKGLPTMHEVIDTCDWGRLRIVSRRGDIVFETGKRPVRILRENALCGTLVEWVVKL